MVRVPLATNTVVVNFRAALNRVLDTAVDVILLDTTFWGTRAPCSCRRLRTFQLGVPFIRPRARHQLATMLHLGTVFPILLPQMPTTSPDRRRHSGRPDAV
jgi:glucarate dehydratase